MTINIGKEALRNSLRDRRWSLPPEFRFQKSVNICQYIKQVISPDEEVLIYCAKEPEVETRWLIKQLIAESIPVIVPIIQQHDISLRLSYLEDITCLTLSTFRVPEPIGYEIPASPDSVTSAIIPLLGFDRSGGRLGYGAGYYDRFLSKNPHIRTIGIAYSCQEVSQIPTDANDIMMEIIVTEEGIRYSKRRDS